MVHWQILQRRIKRLVEAEGRSTVGARLGLTYSGLRSALEGTTIARNTSFDLLAGAYGFAKSSRDGEYYEPQAKEV